MLDEATLQELADGLALRTKAAGYLLEYMTEAEDEEQKKALHALLEDTLRVMKCDAEQVAGEIADGRQRRKAKG